jgi:hypothetical protein
LRGEGRASAGERESRRRPFEKVYPIKRLRVNAEAAKRPRIVLADQALSKRLPALRTRAR